MTHTAEPMTLKRMHDVMAVYISPTTNWVKGLSTGLLKQWIATLDAELAKQREDEPVGEAGSMPSASGFTMACFKASDVPVGTKLYTHPQQRNAVEVTDEREAFENWFSQSHKWTVLRSEHTGNYPDNRMQEAWSGWKARAALSPLASQDKEDAEQWRQKLRGYADRIERAEPYLRNQSITRWVKDITDDLKWDADNA